jgi:hypothetical protein
MNCFVCTTVGRETRAVGFCGHCLVALCSEHHAEAGRHSQGGMRLTCNHALTAVNLPGRRA